MFPHLTRTNFPSGSASVSSQERSAQVNYVQTHTAFLNQLFNALPPSARKPDFSYIARYVFGEHGSQDISNVAAANIIGLLSYVGDVGMQQINKNDQYPILDALLRYQEALATASENDHQSVKASRVVRSHIDVLIDKLLNSESNVQRLKKFAENKIKKIIDDGAYEDDEGINSLINSLFDRSHPNDEGMSTLIDNTIKSYLALRGGDEGEKEINKNDNAIDNYGRIRVESEYFVDSAIASSKASNGQKSNNLNIDPRKLISKVRQRKRDRIPTSNVQVKKSPINDDRVILKLIDKFKMPDVIRNSVSQEYENYEQEGADCRDYKSPEAIASCNMFLEGCRRIGVKQLGNPGSGNNCFISAIYQGAMGSNASISKEVAQTIRQTALDLLKEELKSLNRRKNNFNKIGSEKNRDKIEESIKEIEEELEEPGELGMIKPGTRLAETIIHVMEAYLGRELNIYEVQAGQRGISYFPLKEERHGVQEVVLIYSNDHFSALVKSEDDMEYSPNRIEERKKELQRSIEEDSDELAKQSKYKDLIKRQGKNEPIRNEGEGVDVNYLNELLSQPNNSWASVLRFIKEEIKSCERILDHNCRELDFYNEYEKSIYAK